MRLFKFLNVAAVSKTTFYRHADRYVQLLIIKAWKKHQNNLFEKLKDESAVLTGDGRCDSPGHSAKYGSYTVIEQKINRVLDFQMVQVCM